MSIYVCINVYIYTYKGIYAYTYIRNSYNSFNLGNTYKCHYKAREVFQ